MNKNNNKKIISGYPVSYAQRRMWFLSRLESKNLINNSSIKVVFTDNLRLDYLQKTFLILLKRHEAFRTNFFQVGDGKIIQVIGGAKKNKIKYFDISQEDSVKKRKLEKELIKNNTEKLFDLSLDSLIRASFVKVSDKKYIFLLTLHHIISDAWTLAFFWKEFSAIYESLEKGLMVNLPELTIQYKDYAVWEQSEDFLVKYLKQKKYWLKQLKSAPTYISLPLDRPRPKVQTYRHSFLKSEFTTEEVKAIDKSCSKLRVTSYTFFLSCFVIMLQGISEERDIVLGTYAANRDHVEMERVAGILLNNLAIRVKSNEEDNIRDFIYKVNKTVLEAMNNKEYPFEKIIDELKINRDASYPPLFNVVFQIFNQDISSLGKIFINHKNKIKFFNTNFFQHDLILRIGSDGNKVGFDFNYNKDLFDKSTILRIAQIYKKLVKEVVKKIDYRISDLRFIKDETKNEFNEKIKNNLVKVFDNKFKKKYNIQQQQIEKEIIKIWQDVLDLKIINRTDSFFQLGGHSLKLIQVYDRLIKLYPGRVSIAELFNYFTVESLAQYLSNNESKNINISEKTAYKKELNFIIDSVKKGELEIDCAVDKLIDS